MFDESLFKKGPLSIKPKFHVNRNITVHFARHRPQIGLIEQIYTDFKLVNSKNQCKSV
jgi:hypothetical protein